jgi:hypothetical protein
MPAERDFTSLRAFLGRVPAIEESIETGTGDDGLWWATITIDIDDPLAWNVVQELASVLNYVAADERLPTVFKPVSPPPYLNGGPRDFLSWVIESTDPAFKPDKCREWLESRLPNPVDDPSQWETDDDGDEAENDDDD